MAWSPWKKGMAVVGSAAALAMLVAGCGASNTGGNGGNGNTSNGTGSSPAASGKPVEGGNIQLDSIANFKDLDPALSYDTTSDELVQEMYDQLLTYKGTTSTLIPDLASSLPTITNNGKTYTFHIRQGVTFWNGDPLTAQSFVDEFERVLSPTIGSPGESFLDPIVVGSTAYNKGQAKTISGISTPDKYTLVINLTQPEPFFGQVLAMPFFSAVDQKFINSIGNTAFDSQKAMGTGAYELASYNGTTAVLKKNPHYFLKDQYGNQLPYLNQITITVNKNGQADALHFEAGQTALMANNTSGIPSSVWPTFLAKPSLKKDIIEAPENAVFYLGLNNQMAPFNNKTVRQAIEYAVNKQRIVQLLNNRVQAANQPLPPGIQGYVKNLPSSVNYQFDVAKAKALLKQAGYPNGFSTTLYSANDPDTIKIDTELQSQLSAVGINVKIDSMDWNSFLTLNEKGKTPMFQLAWIQDFPDASDFLNTLFNTNEQPANNSSMYSNKQVDQWLNQAQTMPNGPQRFALYQKVTEQIMTDAPWVPLYYGKYTYAIQPWVHGYYINPSLMDPLTYIWIDQSHSQG